MTNTSAFIACISYIYWSSWYIKKIANVTNLSVVKWIHYYIYWCLILFHRCWYLFLPFTCSLLHFKKNKTQFLKRKMKHFKSISSELDAAMNLTFRKNNCCIWMNASMNTGNEDNALCLSYSTKPNSINMSQQYSPISLFPIYYKAHPHCDNIVKSFKLHL